MTTKLKKLIAAAISVAMISSAFSVFAEGIATTEIPDNTITAAEYAGAESIFNANVELNATEITSADTYFCKSNTSSYFYVTNKETLHIDADKKGAYIPVKGSWSSYYDDRQLSTLWNMIQDNSSITRVVIHENVQGNIPNGLFENFKHIEQVEIKGKITGINDYAFKECSNLSNISFSDASGVTKVGIRAFNGCRKLTSIDLSNSAITIILSGAFARCESLKSVKLPETLKYINWIAFSGCIALKEINLPSSLKEIGSYAFQDTGLENISLPSSLEKVYLGAFCECENLKTVHIPNGMPNGLLRNGFGRCDQSSAMYHDTDVAFNNTSADIYIDDYIGSLSGEPWGTTGNVHWLNEFRADDIPDQYYYGNPVEPEITVSLVDTKTNSSTALTQGTDYRVSYADNNAVGTATVKVTFLGDYIQASEMTKTFKIVNPALTIEPIEDQVYVGEPVKPKVFVYDSAKGEYLSEGVDYTVSYRNNTGAGVGIADISYINHYAAYSGSETSVNFNILEWDISMLPDGSVNIGDNSVTIHTKDTMYNPEFGPENAISTPDEVYAEYSIEIGSKTYTYTMIEGQDYDMLGTPDGFGIGEATVVIAGKGKFYGEATQKYNIYPYDISLISAKTDEELAEIYINDDSLLDIKSTRFKYNEGKPVCPFGTEITSFGECEELGYACLVPSEYARKGWEMTGRYENNINAGVGSVIIEGEGCFTGTFKYNFEIKPADISGYDYSGPLVREPRRYASRQDFMYKGCPVEMLYIPWRDDMSPSLVENRDFITTYENNDKIGTATAILTGVGNYTGVKRINYEITACDISLATVTVEATENDLMYREVPITPNVLVTFDDRTLTEGEDYTLSYEDNNAVGTAKVIVIGIGNFVGQKIAEFEIIPFVWKEGIDLRKASVDISDTYVYDGTEHKPIPDVTYHYIDRYNPAHPIEGDITLVEGEDYEITSYEDNINVGMGNVVIVGLGECRNNNRCAFEITPHAIDADDVFLADMEDVEFNKDLQTPIPEITFRDTKLVKDVDFTVEYSGDTINVGTPMVTIKGIGNYMGEATTSFAITPRDGSMFTYYILFFGDDYEVFED